MDVPDGVTQDKGHEGFIHLPSAVPALIFLARRIPPFLSLVDREVEFCVLTDSSFPTLCWAFFFLEREKKNPRSCDCTEIELTSQGQKVSRLPT